MSNGLDVILPGIDGEIHTLPVNMQKHIDAACAAGIPTWRQWGSQHADCKLVGITIEGEQVLPVYQVRREGVWHLMSRDAENDLLHEVSQNKLYFVRNIRG